MDKYDIKIAKLQGKIHALRDEQFKEVELPKLKKLVGTYWKYKNSYSFPEEESDYWYIYRRIDSIFNNSLQCTDVQIDKDGRAEIRSREISWYGLGGNWQPSDKKEFIKSATHFKKFINKALK